MKIVVSFNKTGAEARAWESEISAASNRDALFYPFNHGALLDPSHYGTAQALDGVYQRGHSRLQDLYRMFERRIADTGANAVIVENAPPYHPDYLRRLSIYKVLYSADDPGATYLINIPYLHAYDHVFFASPTYSADMDMTEKMRYAGKVNADWLPISVFDFEHASAFNEEEVFARRRDIDIIYVGGFWRQKLPLLAEVRRAFGRRFRVHGFFGISHNLFLNAKYRYGGWISPVGFSERVALYQRARIGINIHWNEHGLGNQRLYHLPANGVMQISDCADNLHRIFQPGREIVGYRSANDLIDKLKYFLDHDGEREGIARQAYGRTMREYRFRDVMCRAAALIKAGIERIAWSR